MASSHGVIYFLVNRVLGSDVGFTLSVEAVNLMFCGETEALFCRDVHFSACCVC
jgi:hypothetical protein